MSDAPKVPAGQQLAQAAEAYIRAHSTEKFSLKTLSAALYVNGSYLLRAFRKETDIPCCGITTRSGARKPACCC